MMDSFIWQQQITIGLIGKQYFEDPPYFRYQIENEETLLDGNALNSDQAIGSSG